MKKKLLFTLLGVLMALPALARDFTYEYEGQTLTYSVISEEDKTVIIKHNDVSGNLIIPEIAKDGNVKYTVTTIGEKAFEGCGNLKQVIIPGSVTNMSETAFENCEELCKAVYPSTIGFNPFNNSSDYCVSWDYNPKNENPIEDIIKYGCFYDSEEKKELKFVSLFYTGVFNIRDTVESIGEDAFFGCSGLTSVIIPNSVTSIGEWAFSCSSLTSVIIPNSVTSIGNSAFYDCGLVKSAYPNTLNNPFSSGIAVPYNPNSAIIEDGWIYGPEKSEILFAPCSLTGDYVIPEYVTSIGCNAFSGCSSLTSVIIPNSATSIGNSAFSGCSSLTSVIIPNSATSIGNSAFSGCSGLTSVTIPNSVKSIGEDTFSGCSSLTSVTIPNSVISIRDYAFSGCSGLTSVTIGNSVRTIGMRAFYGCSGLTSVIIPNSVTSIGNSAFYGCSDLTSVKLSKVLDVIEDNAFAECNSISVIEYPSTTPVKGPGHIFTTSVYDHATLYVPEGSVKIYEKTTPWNYFYDIKEMDFSTISVSSLCFKQSSYTAEIGETIDLNDEVVILPADATDKSLAWKSSDESVATVSNGVVTVLAEGSCEITATTTDGSEISAVCTINAYSGVATIATDELCDVYNMSGILVQRNIKLGEATSLTPGIYIIRQGNAVRKISVK